MLGKIVEFAGVGRTWRFSFPARPTDYDPLQVRPLGELQEHLQLISEWARIYWGAGQAGDDLHILSCCCPSADSLSFYDLALSLPAGLEAAYRRPVSIVGASGMDFQSCADFLLGLRRSWNRATGKVLQWNPSVHGLHPRVCWVGPEIPGLELELQAIEDVYGYKLRPIWTSQGRKRLEEQLRKLGTEGPALGVFSWDVRSQNLAVIAREKLHAQIEESCNEWEIGDMLTMLKLWLGQSFPTFSEAGGMIDGEVSLELLRAKIGQGKVLCVYLDGRTSLKDAMRRAGFPEVALNECFEEIAVDPGRNSNLMESLGDKPERYTHMIYAWDGLRHTTSEVEARFGGNLYKARTAFRAALCFKTQILRSQ